LVPRGYAHGFITTDANTVVQYLVDNDYSPENEGSIYWKEVNGLDKKLYDLIGYEVDDEEIIISDKDFITKNFNV
jgi:dTDP-4-dehydrorhamnose 3,5-epimerase-like enzyme